MKTASNKFFLATINPDNSFSIEYTAFGSHWLIGFVSDSGQFFVDPCGEQVAIDADHIHYIQDIVKKVHHIQRIPSNA